jgi:hypothetical protein
MSWSDFVVEKNRVDTIIDLRCQPVTVLENFNQRVLSIICFLENLEKGIEYDEDIVKGLRADFASKTIEDCEVFIADSQNMEENCHMAIADDKDVYMGTVSLKHIHEGIAVCI